jgi:IS605 OrfB family transposase
MKRIVRVRLRVTPEQADALSRTLTACNAGANHTSAVAFDAKSFNAFELQKLVYGHLKANGLSAQPSIRSIKKAAAAYKTLRANARIGNLGRRGSAKYEKAMGKPIRFRDDAAQPFDDRCLSWQPDKQTVSIWTVDGRMRAIPFVGDPAQLDRLRQFRQGESDLVTHQGKWYLVATVDEPVPDLIDPEGFVGVDMGIVNIATTSAGQNWSGARVNRVRHKNRRLRAKLQAKGTKSARRLLKKISGRENRFVTNTNHVISKSIVTEAKRTGRGIAVEDLTGIRARVRLRKPQRVTLHSWAFAQLGAFLSYKADGAGLPFVQVDPAYTSQQCNACTHTDKKNRVDQATFACQSCGVSLHADKNASLNIADRGVQAWGALNLPHAD